MAYFRDLSCGDFLVEFKLFFHEISEIAFYEIVLEHNESALSLFVLEVDFVHDFPVFEHKILSDVLFEGRGQVDREVDAFVVFRIDLLDLDDDQSIVGFFFATVNVALLWDLPDVLIILGFDEFFYFMYVFRVALQFGL